MNRPSSLFATRSFLFGIAALLCVMAGPAPAQEAETETAPAADPNQRYAACMTMARSDPAAAEGEAIAWVAENGAAAAQHCQAAQAWMLSGGYDRAIADLDQSIVLAPYDVEFVIDRAVAKASGGLYWEAIDDLNNASEMAPARSDILILRASAYRFVEANELAMEDIVRVLEVEPQNAEAIFERGMLHAIAGSIEEARADWQQVVQLVPGSATAEAAQANLEATAPVPE